MVVVVHNKSRSLAKFLKTHNQATVSTGGDYQSSHQVVPRPGQIPKNTHTQAVLINLQ